MFKASIYRIISMKLKCISYRMEYKHDVFSNIRLLKCFHFHILVSTSHSLHKSQDYRIAISKIKVQMEECPERCKNGFGVFSWNTTSDYYCPTALNVQIEVYYKVQKAFKMVSNFLSCVSKYIKQYVCHSFLSPSVDIQ